MSALTVEDALVLIKESIAEQNAAYKAEQAERDAVYKAEQAKREAEFNATLERIDRMHKQFAIADERFERIQRLTGSFKRNLGEIIEFVMMPKLRAEINKCGHEFYVISPNKRFEKKDGGDLAEIDLFLENGDEVMAIEIKSNCKAKDIKEHAERLVKLRKNENITGLKGKVMYAAVAVVSIKDSVRDLALKHGMYVITVREEEDRVDVITPKTRGTW